MIYRGVKYNGPTKVEAAYDGVRLTYRGIQYNRETNLLDQVRRIANKNLRYRGAQLHMAKQ